MLRWALFFALLSLISGLFGFTGIAAGSVNLAKILFILFLAGSLVSLVLGFRAAG